MQSKHKNKNIQQHNAWPWLLQIFTCLILISQPTLATHSPIWFTEEDSSPAVTDIKKITVSNGKLTNQGNGTILLDLSSGGGASAIDDLSDAIVNGDCMFLGNGSGANYSGPGNDKNTALGYQSLYSNTFGYYNTAIGSSTLYNNTIGYSNVAIGYRSLNGNTEGHHNTAIGEDALYSNNTGYYNTAIGYESLRSNTEGYYNTAIGHQSLFNNTTGENNIAIGKSSLEQNTTGQNNIALGQSCLKNNTTGQINSALGYYALYSNNTGSGNSALGPQSLMYNTTGIDNTALGYYTLFNNTTGDNNTAVGKGAGAGVTTGNGNILIGLSAGSDLTTGSQNIMIGYGVQVPDPEASYQINIGDTIHGNISSGNVGIGTTTPGSKLDVNGTLTVEGFVLETGAADGYVLTSDGSGVATWQELSGGGGPITSIHVNNGTAADPTISFQNDNGHGLYIATEDEMMGTNYLGFSTSDTNRMVITSTGNVGINGLLANEILDVNGNIAMSGKIIAGATGAAAPAYTFTDNTGIGLYSDGAGGVGIAQGGSSKIFADSMGNVGIGTTSPSGFFDVAGEMYANVIRNVDGSAGAPSYAFENNSDAGFYNISGNIGISTGGANAMYISSAGVGIGNTSPDMSAKLDVTGATYSTSVVVSDGNAATPAYTFKNSTETGMYYGGSGNIVLSATQVPMVYVSNVGMGIKDSSPNYELEVNGTIATEGFRLGTSSTAGYGLISDLNGVGTWQAITASAAGSNREIQFNNGGSLAANANLTWNADILTVAGTVSATGFKMTTGATNGYVLTSNGSGVATWQAAAGGGGGSSDIDGLEDAISNQADSIFIGNGSGLANSGSTYATAVGIGALEENSTGVYNSAFGYQALKSNTTASENTAVGYTALYSNTTGGSNTATGYSALFSNTSGSLNTAIGNMSLSSNTTGNYNTASGRTSLNANTTGASNTAHGVYALRYTETGNGNTAVGYQAGEGTMSNSFSNGAFLGHQTGLALTTGDNNTMIGFGSGVAVTTGANNIVLGYKAGDNITTGSSNIIIGYNVDAPDASASNQLNIGNTIYGNTANGTVGVATTTPQTNLDVNGSSMINTLLSKEVITNSSAANVTINWNSGNIQTITLGTNVTFSFTAPTVGIGRFTIMLVQDGTGSRTVTWPGSILWPGGTAPDLTTTANAVDIITCLYNGTSYYCQGGFDFQ